MRHFISITVGPSLTNGPSGFFTAVATRSLPQTGHLHFSFIDSASSIIEKRSAEYAADDDSADPSYERAEHTADAGRVNIVVIVVAIIGFIVFRIIGIILAEFTFCVELFRIIVCGIFVIVSEKALDPSLGNLDLIFGTEIVHPLLVATDRLLDFGVRHCGFPRCLFCFHGVVPFFGVFYDAHY